MLSPGSLPSESLKSLTNRPTGVRPADSCDHGNEEHAASTAGAPRISVGGKRTTDGTERSRTSNGSGSLIRYLDCATSVRGIPRSKIPSRRRCPMRHRGVSSPSRAGNRRCGSSRSSLACVSRVEASCWGEFGPRLLLAEASSARDPSTRIRESSQSRGIQARRPPSIARRFRWWPIRPARKIRRERSSRASMSFASERNGPGH